MNKKIVLFAIILATVLGLNAIEYTLPKVLFVTTGDGDGRGTVSDGVILALQEFNKSGAFMRLENRKILHDFPEMSQYQIMVLPTTFGYHDADRRYSLSFLSDAEMRNIINWVKNGGTLISDVYLGRNSLSGEDRISKSGELKTDNWILAECFGVNLQEKNMENFYITKSNIDVWTSNITEKFDEPEWTPVVTEIVSNKAKVLANWDNEEVAYPAITQNKFFKGNTILLGNFNIIHPARDGGFSNTKEIQNFYHYAYTLAVDGRKYPIDLNPWKNGAQSTFCLTFDDGGSLLEYERVFDLINQNNIKTTFFVTGNIESGIKQRLLQENMIKIGGHSHTHPDFRTLSYPQTVTEFLVNKASFNIDFKGFRFPFTNNSFWGMMVMEELDYHYDTSIAINHLDFYRGSVFPYNIPIFKDGYYRSLDLLELSQNYHDDWYYFQDVLEDDDYNCDKQKRDSAKFDSYLKRLWERAILPNHGLMVFLGHPMYSGISEITLEPVKNMIQRAKESNAWITNLDEVANYWNKLKDLKILITEKENSVQINFNLDDVKIIENLSLRLQQKPKKIKFSKKYHFVENEAGLFIVLNSIGNGDVVEIQFVEK